MSSICGFPFVFICWFVDSQGALSYCGILHELQEIYVWVGEVKKRRSDD